MRKQLFRQIKKLTLTGMLAFTFSLQPISVLAESWSRVGNAYQMPDGTHIQGVHSRGIDVSHWQREIDWNQVRQGDVDFVMLGTRYQGDVDPYFRINAERAHEAGLKLGAYLYSYAVSVETAEQEADFILDLIKDYPISYPVAFDAEDNATLGMLEPSQVSEVINAFCKKIEDAGYYPMVYANEYWLNNKIDLSMIDYDIWVARYNTMYTYASPSMWQATNTGSIPGINGNVDINFLFTDYSRIIPENTWRTIDGNTYYYQNHLMQKDSWIHDGTGWFYLNPGGNPVKGWMTRPEGWYYLEETTGQMATDWKRLENDWYYFGQSGLMASGWEQIDGTWYYLGQDGKMMTGWQNIDGKQYYLADSGAMRTGWQTLGESSYYFHPSGEMASGWVNTGNQWYYTSQIGQMQTGWQNVNGSWYLLDQSGVMLTGWQEAGGTRYFLDQSGAMLTGWQDIDGAWYYLDQSGAMLTGWQDIDGSWYYLDQSGIMLTGWQDIDGILYYLDDASGRMAADTELDRGGIPYHADATGACTQL